MLMRACVPGVCRTFTAAASLITPGDGADAPESTIPKKLYLVSGRVSEKRSNDRTCSALKLVKLLALLPKAELLYSATVNVFSRRSTIIFKRR